MRLPDPFTHPQYSGLGFETAVLIDNDPMIRDELPNGSVLEVKSAAQFYGINITYPDLYPDEYAILSSFILEYKRTRGFIDVLLPHYEVYRVRGNPSTTTIASGQKGNSIQIGNTGGLTGTPNPGDLFQLSTHPKVYKITSFQNVSGVWTLGLYPDLMITTNGSEKPVFTGILFRTKLMNGDSFTEEFTADGVYPGQSLNLRESI
ncbi:hypothetical protein [Bacteriophage Eos]|nr:hypothetical protein [Bacteriophage Eos]